MVSPKAKTLRNKILTGSLIFYALSGLTALLNYAFYPLIGRLVSVGQYGEIQFLVSMFNQFAVGFVVLNILAIIISVRYPDSTHQAQLIKSLNKVGIGATLLIVGVGVAILYLQQNELGLHEPAGVLCLGLALVANVPFTILIGRLQGNDKFMIAGIVGIFGAFAKLVISGMFVLTGLGVAGAVTGLGIGTLLAYIVGLYFMRASMPAKGDQQRHTYQLAIKTMLVIKKEALASLLGVAYITFLSVFDTIVARIHLSHNEAGEYSAVATVAKIVLVATTPIVWIALPAAVAGKKRAVEKLFVLTIVLSVVIGALFTIFSAQSIQLLTGISPTVYNAYMPLTTIGAVFSALALLIVCVLVCMNRIRSVVVMCVSSAALALFAYLALLPQGPISAALVSQIVAGGVITLSGIILLHKLRP